MRTFPLLGAVAVILGSRPAAARAQAAPDTGAYAVAATILATCNLRLGPAAADTARAEELWAAGLWKLKDGDWRGLRQIREAMRLDPHNGRYVSEYPLYLGAIGLRRESEAAYRAAIARQPDCRRNWYGLASILEQAERFTEALEVRRRTARAGAGWPPKWRAHESAMLGFLASRAGAHALAVAYYTRALLVDSAVFERPGAGRLRARYEESLRVAGPQPAAVEP